MTRDTARALKAIDMDILRVALTLDNMIEMRAKLDQQSTEELVREIMKSLLLTARKEEPHP